MLLGEMGARTEKFQFSFYPDCLSEWNTLDPVIRNAPSVAAFKHKLLSKIRPPPVRSIFGIHDAMGVSYLSQITSGLSKLNFHKFKHILKDTMNLLFPTNDGVEYAEHFFCFALLTIDDIFSLESQ